MCVLNIYFHSLHEIIMYQKILDIYFLVMTDKHCPDGYQKYVDDCYQVITKPLVWEDAVKECKKDRGDLVSFRDHFQQGMK